MDKISLFVLGLLVLLSQVAWAADTTPPTIAIQSPANTTYNSSSIDLNFTVSDNVNVSSCLYELDGVNTTITGCQNTSIKQKIWSKQESATTYTCVGTWNNCVYANDNDYAITYASWSLGAPAQRYENYSLTGSGTLSSAYLEVKYGFSNFNFTNATIQASCIDAANTNQVLEIELESEQNYDADRSGTRYYCKNSTGWVIILNATGSYFGGSPTIYEAAIWKYSAENLTNGNHLIKVWANDTSNNWNVSSTINFTVSPSSDGIPPSISIQSPQNTTYTTATVDLNFTATDSDGVLSCLYELDGTNTTISNCQNITAANNWRHQSTPDASACQGWVSCNPLNDNDLSTGSSVALAAGTAIYYENYTIPSDVGAAFYELKYANNGVLGEGVTSWAFSNASIPLSCLKQKSVLELKVTSGGNLNETPGSMYYCKSYAGDWLVLENATPSNWSLYVYELELWWGKFGNLADGSHSIKIWANDTGGNWNVSQTTSFTIDTRPPVITLNSPANNTWTSTGTPVFSVTATDNIALSGGCNLTVDNTRIAAGTWTNNTAFTMSNSTTLTDGTHYWNVSCADTIGNSNTSATRTLKIDTVRPAVSCASCPASSTNPAITFSVTATDALSGVDSVRLYYRGNYYTMAPNGSTYSYTLSENNNGEYSYQFFVNDSAGNVNSTLTGSVVIGASSSSPPPPPYVPPAPSRGGSSGAPPNLNELSPEELARLGELVENISKARKNATVRNSIVFIERPVADQINLTAIASLVDRAKFDPHRLNEPYVFPNASEFDSLRSVKISKIEVLTVSSVATAAVAFWVLGPGILFFGSSLALIYLQAFWLAVGG